MDCILVAKKGQRALFSAKLVKKCHRSMPRGSPRSTAIQSKGLTPEPLTSRQCAWPDEAFPFDRAYAIENGPSGFDPAAPPHLPKIAFLMLMRNERLAALATRFDEGTAILTIRRDGVDGCRGQPRHRGRPPGDRSLLRRFCRRRTARPRQGATALPASPSRIAGEVPLAHQPRFAPRPRSPCRSGGPPAPLPRQHPCRGASRLERVRLGRAANRKPAMSPSRPSTRIDRCAATNVNPDTAERDLAIPRKPATGLRPPDCGVYLKVVEGGGIAGGARRSARSTEGSSDRGQLKPSVPKPVWPSRPTTARCSLRSGDLDPSSPSLERAPARLMKLGRLSVVPGPLPLAASTSP